MPQTLPSLESHTVGCSQGNDREGKPSLPQCSPEVRYRALGFKVSLLGFHLPGDGASFLLLNLPFWGRNINLYLPHHWSLEVCKFDTYKDSLLSLDGVLDELLSLDI